MLSKRLNFVELGRESPACSAIVHDTHVLCAFFMSDTHAEHIYLTPQLSCDTLYGFHRLCGAFYSFQASG